MSRLRNKALSPSSAEPKRVNDAGSGVDTTLELPCIDTKPSLNVSPRAAGPPKVIVAGNVRLLICPAPRDVVWLRLSVIEHALKNAVAPPLTWQEPLLATPEPVGLQGRVQAAASEMIGV